MILKEVLFLQLMTKMILKSSRPSGAIYKRCPQFGRRGFVHESFLLLKNTYWGFGLTISHAIVVFP